MASLFSKTSGGVQLLDAGAGTGALTLAFLHRWESGSLKPRSVHAVLYELDSCHASAISTALSSRRLNGFSSDILCKDFIPAAAEQIEAGNRNFTHAILNPPYKKIASDSEHRRTLRRVGIETVNLYSAFVALTIKLMRTGGEIVAILPRSFCNGPYYRPFRKFLLAETAIQHIHLFDSRTKAFQHDDVLQENVILKLQCGKPQGTVVVSTSTDDTFTDYAESSHQFESIVSPRDPEQFIHIPTCDAHSDIPGASLTLKELGLTVSTGPVVDFRTEGLQHDPGPSAVPLLYPLHVSSGEVRWPAIGAKKPNAIVPSPTNERWLFPTGNYCVVRRFSSKEEKRRIVATFIPADAFTSFSSIGFENHLNVFHRNKAGIPHLLARGLAVYLNSSAVDAHFRRFSGHTQVNATDLRKLLYPPENILVSLGNWAAKADVLSQQLIDAAYEKAIA